MRFILLKQSAAAASVKLDEDIDGEDIDGEDIDGEVCVVCSRWVYD